MRKNYYTKWCFYFFLLISCTLLSSCATVAPLPVEEPTPGQISMERHMNQEDVYGLINDYKEYPEYRKKLGGYILFDIDYSKYSYSDLLSIKQSCSCCPELAESFDLTIIEREDEILERLSEMDLRQAKSYYDFHPAEKVFLRPVIENALSSIIDSLEYPDVKYVHSIFRDSEFSNITKPVYEEWRKLLLPYVKKNVNQYLASEKSTFAYYRDLISLKIQDHLSTVFEKIMDDCLDKDLPRSQQDIDKRIQSIISNRLNEKELSRIICENVNEYISIANKSRDEYLQELYSYFIPDETYHIQKLNTKKITPYSGKCDWSSLYEVSRIQHTSTGNVWLSIASLLTGGWLGAVLSIADMAYTYKGEKKLAEESIPYIETFAKSLDAYLYRVKEYYSSKGSSILSSQKVAPTEKFKNYAYEIY